MGLFEIDNGKLIPAQFGRKVTTGVDESVLHSVRTQILQVIDRPLFPVAWLKPEDIYKNLPSDMPHSVDSRKRLISFDISGQLVVVEVISTLNSKVLTDSLAFLSRASNLSWKEIANFYPGGVQEFASSWMSFRENKPMNVSTSPRLILVVNEIEASMRPALDILLESGLAIYELDMRSMSNGRRFLEVKQLNVLTFKSSLENMLSAGSNMNMLVPDSMSVAAHTTMAVPSQKADTKPNVSVKSSSVSRLGSRRKVVSENTENIEKPKAIKYMEKNHVPVQFDSQGLAVISALSDEEEISLYLPAICRGGAFGFLRKGEIHAINAIFDDANKAYIAIADYFMVTLDPRIHPNSGWDAIKLGAANGPSITEAIREINHKGKISL